MLREKKKPPLFFLAPSEREDLRIGLEAPNSPDWLLAILCCYVREFLFRAFRPPDPPEVVASVVRHLGEALYTSILEQLKRHFPKDASRGEAVLLRCRSERAGRLFVQARSRLGDLWFEDFLQHPRDSVVDRCKRHLKSLERLPDIRGKSALGTTYKILYLIFYKEALRSLDNLPEQRGPMTEVEKSFRKEVFDNAFSRLPKVFNRQSRSFYHPQTGEIFFEVPDEELNCWLTLPKSKIAEEIAVHVVKGGTQLSANSLHNLLPKLRRMAQQVDHALKRS